MKVRICQELPRGFDNYEPHSWECELYAPDGVGQVLVPIRFEDCREKDNAEIGDFVAVRLDESGKTGTIAGRIVEIL